MGILKLQSLYKKKSKKDARIAAAAEHSRPTIAKLRPLSLHIDNLELTATTAKDTGPSGDSSITINSPAQQQCNNTSNGSRSSRACVGLNGVFDKGLAGIDTTASAETKESFEQDFSLAFALSQQLQLEHERETPASTTAHISTNHTNLATNKGLQQRNPSSHVQTNQQEGPNGFANNSIYSSYTRNLATLEDNSNRRDSFSTSMFDHLLKPSSSLRLLERTRETQDTCLKQQQRPTANATMTTTTTVLDSDISDSDDDDNEEALSKIASDEETGLNMSNKHPNGLRITKGVQPIMERRGGAGGDFTQSRLFVQRKVDNWASRIDPESNRIEANEAVIQRMRDRHRFQVKMAALRQQKLQQGGAVVAAAPAPGGIATTTTATATTPYQHMVPQASTQGYYGSPMPAAPSPQIATASVAIMSPSNIVLPPTAPTSAQGMMPFQIYYSPTPTPLATMTVPPISTDFTNALKEQQQQPKKCHASLVAAASPSVTAVPVPDAFLPNPNHTSLAADKAAESDDLNSASLGSEQTKSVSPVVNVSNRSTSSVSSITSYQQKPAVSNSVRGSQRQSIHSQNSAVTTQVPTWSIAKKKQATPTTAVSERQDATESAASSTKLSTSSTFSNDTDDESGNEPTDDEDEAAEADVESINEDEQAVKNIRHHCYRKQSTTKVRKRQERKIVGDTMAMRPSKSTPNFGKAKQKHTTSSNATSRRSSQGTVSNATADSSPLSEEVLLTPPPPPLPPYPHCVNEQPQLQRPSLLPRSSSLRNMKSESELKASRSSINGKGAQQQQQLNQEWERMQQFTNQAYTYSSHYQPHQQQQQQQPLMLYYSPATTMMPTPYYYQVSMPPPPTPQMNRTTHPLMQQQPNYNARTNSSIMDHHYSYHPQQQQQRASHMSGLHFAYSNKI